MRKIRNLMVIAGLAAMLFVFSLPGGSVDQGKAWANLLADQSQGQTYVGRAKCASCHLKENSSWKKMKHAQAFEDLPESYRDDKSCLACHVTGLGDSTGFKSPTETPQLAAVACEACHGPGSEHAQLGDTIAKKEKDASYWTKQIQSAAWKKDNEQRMQAIKNKKIPEIAVDEKGQFKGKNLHEMFEEFKNDKGESVKFSADRCAKCHTSENGKKTHPDYKK